LRRPHSGQSRFQPISRINASPALLAPNRHFGAGAVSRKNAPRSGSQKSLGLFRCVRENYEHHLFPVPNPVCLDERQHRHKFNDVARHPRTDSTKQPTGMGLGGCVPPIAWRARHGHRQGMVPLNLVRVAESLGPVSDACDQALDEGSLAPNRYQRSAIPSTDSPQNTSGESRGSRPSTPRTRHRFFAADQARSGEIGHVVPPTLEYLVEGRVGA
jgi:hypothetical protein